jgi:hypothetical protein
MATSNVDRFDQLTGKIFAALYESFPIPVDLEYREFVDVILVDPDDTPEGKKQILEGKEFFHASFRWLESSGYLTIGTQGIGSPKINGCVLTAKALEALKAIPDNLSGESIGSRLQTAAKDGMVETIKSLTGKALGIGATMGYSAAVAWANS